jgi:hypothetical protein
VQFGAAQFAIHLRLARSACRRLDKKFRVTAGPKSGKVG